MMTTQHYDDEALLALLERGGNAVANADEHIASCGVCREMVAAYGAIVECLGDEGVWDVRPMNDEPVPETIENLRAFVVSARSEDADAELLTSELLEGLREEWMPRLMADSSYRTAGVVRRLCVAAEEVSGKWPADELAITELATEIAEHLDPAAYPPHAVARLRGDSWRGRAYALDYTGDLHAAMASITRAKQQYDALPVADYDLARLELTRALILRHFDRYDEGLEAVRSAEPALRAAGDTHRLRIARWIEAAMRYRARDYHRALHGWLELEGELAGIDEKTRAGVLHNIALCYRDLGDHERALQYYRYAAEAHAKLDASAEETLKLRWNIGSILLAMQRFDDAAIVLTSLITAFSDLQMREDAILVRLEFVELLIVQEHVDQAITECEQIIAELRASGLEQTERALIAVTYLREATQAKRATANLARHVREFVRDSRTQPALLFAPPPM
jgi:tetratricopeptide (TPR) repeat protein